jgi:hypothetical protein
MTAWNDFVKKIYHEGHDKDPNYMFKHALKDASKRKSEMGSSTASGVKSKKQGKKSKKSNKSKKNRKSRKNRK